MTLACSTSSLPKISRRSARTADQQFIRRLGALMSAARVLLTTSLPHDDDDTFSSSVSGANSFCCDGGAVEGTAGQVSSRHKSLGPRPSETPQSGHWYRPHATARGEGKCTTK